MARSCVSLCGCFRWRFWVCFSISRLSASSRFGLSLQSLTPANLQLAADTLGFTFYQAALSTMLTLAVGLPAAALFAYFSFPGKTLLRALTAIPFMLPTVVVASGFSALLGPRGWLNVALTKAFDLQSPPIAFTGTLLAILVAHMFYNTTIVIRLVGGALSSLDPRLSQAAATLGATPWRVRWRVVLPLLRPSLLAATLLVFLFDFTSFGVILLLGGPSFSTLEVQIYVQALQLLDLRLAALLSFIQLLCTLAFTVLYSRTVLRMFVRSTPRAAQVNLRPAVTPGQQAFVWVGVFVLASLFVLPMLSLPLRSVTRLEADRGQRQAPSLGFTAAYYSELFVNRQDFDLLCAARSGSSQFVGLRVRHGRPLPSNGIAGRVRAVTARSPRAVPGPAAIVAHRCLRGDSGSGIHLDVWKMAGLAVARAFGAHPGCPSVRDSRAATRAGHFAASASTGCCLARRLAVALLAGRRLAHPASRHAHGRGLRVHHLFGRVRCHNSACTPGVSNHTGRYLPIPLPARRPQLRAGHGHGHVADGHDHDRHIADRAAAFARGLGVLMLDLRAIHKSYQGKELLDGLSLSVGMHETVCLLGPSGSGKSTVLQIIAGLETPKSGRVLWDGHDLASTPAHLRDFGLVFQDYALFPHLDVFENVAFGPRMKGWSPDEVRRRVDEVLDLVDLAGFDRRLIDNLSGGEQQRVALARALAPGPRLLMLDEPLGALDHSLRQELLDQLRALLRQSGIPALYVTHDQEEAFKIADRIAFLHAGHIVQEGTPNEIWTKPASPWVATFLGLGGVLEGKVLAQGRLQTPAGTFSLPCRHGHRRGDPVRVLARTTPEGRGALLRGIVVDAVFQPNGYRVMLRQRLVLRRAAAAAPRQPRSGQVAR